MVDYGDNPGPGAYCAKIHLITEQAPIYTLGGRLRGISDGTKPGPGQYDPKLGPGGPSYTLKGKLNPLKNQNPGPGAYSPYAYEQLPKVSLHQRLDGGNPAAKNPGPGSYETDHPHCGDAPAFTMGFRIERKRPPNRNMNKLKRKTSK